MTGQKLVRKWILEYAFKYRYTSIVHQMLKSDHDSEVEETTLLVRQAICFLHTILHEEDVENFSDAIAITEEINRLAPHLIPYKLYARILTGLKTRYLFNILENNENMALPRLNQYFPRGGCNHSRADQRVKEKLEHGEKLFRKLFLSLIAHDDLRTKYMKKDFKQQFGTAFWTKLKLLTTQFVKRIDGGLPPTVMEKLLWARSDSKLIVTLTECGDPAFEILLDAIHRKSALSEDDIVELLRVLYPAPDQSAHLSEGINFTLTSDESDFAGNEADISTQNVNRTKKRGRKPVKKQAERSTRKKSRSKIRVNCEVILSDGDQSQPNQSHDDNTQTDQSQGDSSQGDLSQGDHSQGDLSQGDLSQGGQSKSTKVQKKSSDLSELKRNPLCSSTTKSTSVNSPGTRSFVLGRVYQMKSKDPDGTTNNASKTRSVRSVTSPKQSPRITRNLSPRHSHRIRRDPHNPERSQQTESQKDSMSSPTLDVTLVKDAAGAVNETTKGTRSSNSSVSRNNQSPIKENVSEKSHKKNATREKSAPLRSEKVAVEGQPVSMTDIVDVVDLTDDNNSANEPIEEEMKTSEPVGNSTVYSSSPTNTINPTSTSDSVGLQETSLQKRTTIRKQTFLQQKLPVRRSPRYTTEVPEVRRSSRRRRNSGRNVLGSASSKASSKGGSDASSRMSSQSPVRTPRTPKSPVNISITVQLGNQTPSRRTPRMKSVKQEVMRSSRKRRSESPGDSTPAKVTVEDDSDSSHEISFKTSSPPSPPKTPANKVRLRQDTPIRRTPHMKSVEQDLMRSSRKRPSDNESPGNSTPAKVTVEDDSDSSHEISFKTTNPPSTPKTPANKVRLQEDTPVRRSPRINLSLGQEVRRSSRNRKENEQCARSGTPSKIKKKANESPLVGVNTPRTPCTNRLDQGSRRSSRKPQTDQSNTAINTPSKVSAEELTDESSPLSSQASSFYTCPTQQTSEVVDSSADETSATSAASQIRKLAKRIGSGYDRDSGEDLLCTNVSLVTSQADPNLVDDGQFSNQSENPEQVKDTYDFLSTLTLNKAIKEHKRPSEAKMCIVKLYRNKSLDYHQEGTAVVEIFS